MTYEQKAEIFTNLIATTGSVADALRKTDAVVRRQKRSGRLSSDQVEEARRLREQGWKLAAIGERFGVTESFACMICRGVARPPRPAPALHPLGLAIVREVARLIDLPTTWLEAARRGKQPPAESLARAAAIVAMRAGGLTYQQIGTILRRDHSTIVGRLERAQQNRRAREIADVALAEARQRVDLAGGGGDEGSAQVEQGRAA